jgi:glycosyltransferase involved in cell wall biosynthesis
MASYTYSIIIPAYNEQVWLPKTIMSARKAMESLNVSGELIVVDNNSNDNTAAIANYYGAEVVFEPFNQISRARNAGSRYARGKYLIFLDADTILSKELLRMAVERLSTGKCCGGGALVGFNETIPKIIRWGVRMWNGFSETYGMAAGCFIYCTRKGFNGVGGFSEDVYASEEFRFSNKLKAWGAKRNLGFEIIKHPFIITSARKLQWFSPVELILVLLIGTLPFAARSRSLCSFWYRRPPR